jgi:hypothetical protein
MKQRNTSTAHLTSFVKVSGRNRSRNCLGSRMQLEFTTIFLYTDKPRVQEITPCQVLSWNSTTHPQLLSLFWFLEETFIANAQLAGCNWNSPQYFCIQITKNRRDHPLSGSVMKQHNTPPAPITILARVSGRNLHRLCSASRMQLEFTIKFLYTDAKNTRDHPLSGSVMKQHNTPPAPLTILDRVSGIKIANAQLIGCNWNSPQYFCIQLNQESRRSPLVRFYH